MRFKIISVLMLFSLLSLLLFSCGDDQKESEEDPWAEVESESEPEETAPPEPVEIVENPTFAAKPIDTGWVTALALNVRRSPGTGSAVDGHLFKGDKVDIFEKQSVGGNSWLRVSDEVGYVDGWVSGGFVSQSRVEPAFVEVPLDQYKAAKTPSVVEGISAKYIGVQSCIPCHNKPHAGFSLGAYGVWRDHFHANAFKTLSRKYSIAFAKKRGIDDPANNWRCVKCHVTAYGVPAERLGSRYTQEEGVSCEACHGPGGDYLRPHTDPNASEDELRAMGFRVFSDLDERDQMCRSCHNQLSPTYKPFNVIKFSSAIRHWENEYVIAAVDETDPQAEPEIKQVKAPPEKKLPKPAEVKEVVAPPPPPPPKPEQPKPKPSGGGDSRLAAMANDWMLDKVGTRGPAFFSHVKHIKQYVAVQSEAEVCQVCHHTSKAGATPTNCSGAGCHQFEPTAKAPNRKDAFHDNCKGCHLDEGSGPTKCSECHDKSQL